MEKATKEGLRGRARRIARVIEDRKEQFPRVYAAMRRVRESERKVKSMDFTGLPQKEIVEYIDKRIAEGADDSAIKAEIRSKWPLAISEDGIADSYIVHSHKKAK